MGVSTAIRRASSFSARVVSLRLCVPRAWLTRRQRGVWTTALAVPPAFVQAVNVAGLVVIAFAIVGAYVVLLPLVGFRVATVLFVGALQAALGRPQTARQWGVLAAIALGTATLSYFVFERYLLVLLPRGAWTGF